MTGNKSWRETAAVLSILLVAYAAYGYGAHDIIFNARTWVDEITYLIKSWRYVTGSSAPYTDQDPTWYMPLYFYQLGIWQTFFGTGIEAARLQNVLIGALSGILVFDTVRRVTGNRTAAALSVLVLLTTPSVVFYFSSVTPISAVSFLLILSIWIIVGGLSAARIWRSLALGLLLAALYFYRQNMILAAAALIPIHILTLRKNRWSHLGALVLGLSAVTAAMLLIFPDRLAVYAMRLPVVTPLLASLNLISDPLFTIQNNATSSMTLTISLSRIAWQDIVDAFLLPYAGLIVSMGAVFLLARGALKVLWTAPLVFIFLSVTHYMGSLGYCSTCILPYTASYAAVGSICAGIAFALTWRSAKREMLPPGTLTVIFCFVIIGLNVTASGLASRPEYRFYPSAMLTNPRPLPETVSTQNLAEFIRSNTSGDHSILPIHNLATVPLAVFRSGRDFPVQGINMRHSHRKLRDGLSDAERTETLLAIQKEGLWTDEILEQWLDEDYDTILFQVDPRDRESDLLTRIEDKFERTAETGFRGWNVYIYERRAATSGREPKMPARPE